MVRVTELVDGAYDLETTSRQRRIRHTLNNMRLDPIQIIVGAVRLIPDGTVKNQWILESRIDLET